LTVKARRREANAYWVVGVWLVVLIFLASRYGREASDGNEHPALPHVPGAKVVASERKEQGEMTIPLERVVFDLQTQKFNNFKNSLGFGSSDPYLIRAPGTE
jgi:hypothetical protein